MTRIAIIGNAGGGKSILARHLGQVLGLTVHSVDDVQWEPGWRHASLEKVADAHATWLRGRRWIVEGWGAWDLIEARFAAADAIVIIDFPFDVHVRWALRRQAEVALGRRRDWPPPGCSATGITAELLHTMRYVHAVLRPRLLTLASDARFAPKVVHLRSPRAVRQWRATASQPGMT